MEEQIACNEGKAYIGGTTTLEDLNRNFESIVHRKFSVEKVNNGFIVITEMGLNNYVPPNTKMVFKNIDELNCWICEWDSRIK